MKTVVDVDGVVADGHGRVDEKYFLGLLVDSLSPF
jgi:hypothetical protein